MNNVINMVSRVSVDLTKEKWDQPKTVKMPRQWTRKEYMAAYIKMLTIQANK